jgi:hypothetical protein
MPRVIDLGRGEPSLNIASYGRRGPGQRVSLTAAEVAHAVRTARGAPEVVVKVSGGASTTKGVRKHLDYIGRDGELEIETDDGQLIQKRGFEKRVIEDWDLDLEERKGSRRRAITTRAKPPKLVHNVVFSMPAGTPAKKVQAAVRKFAREKFALQHRYLMALHTDQPQPHVHLVVKAVSEQGVRLNIRRATLREWRRDFAANLRELGVEANATERAVRGVSTPRKSDGIYRAWKRGASTHVRARAQAVANELKQGVVRPEPGLATLARTREAVLTGWSATADMLNAAGRHDDAALVRRFAARMPPVQTEKSWISHKLRKLIEAARARSAPELAR